MVRGEPRPVPFPPRVSFRHLYFSPDRRGAHARDDAAAALTKLAGQPEDSSLAATLADTFMFQEYYRDRAPEFLGKEFGPNFALAVGKISPGSWQGPVESGFGWHLVFVDTLIPGRRAPGSRGRREDCLARRAEGTGVAAGLRRHSREVHGVVARAG
jgi:hypothetical protein